MNIFNYKNIFTLVTLFSFISCEKEIEFNNEDLQPQLVLNTIINNDSEIYAYLARTSILNDVEGRDLSINEGTIVVYENGNLVSELINDGDGKYITAYKAKKAEYTFKASASNFEDVSGSTVIPEAVPIIAIDSIGTLNTNYDNKTIYQLTFDDPAGEKNYYSVKVSYTYFWVDDNNDTIYEKNYVNIETVSSSLEDGEIEFEIFDDPEIDFMVYFEGLFFTDEEFDGKQHKFKFSAPEFLISNPYHEVKIELNHHDYNSYLYQRSVSLQSNSSAFDEPAPIHNNIENGFGIVGSYNSSYITFPATESTDVGYYNE